MKYATVVTDSVVIVVDTTTGKDVKVHSTSSNYGKAVELIKAGKFADVFNFDVKTTVEKFIKTSAGGHAVVKIDNGVGYIYLSILNTEIPLDSVITDKIMKMAEQGFDSRPLINFLGNLYRNPSATAIKELYLFIEACELPITEDGCFIAYKIVKNDYMDIYSGTVRNMVGDKPSMHRQLVDDNRNNTCSKGLHFCSKAYLGHYGSGSRANDRCMLVKINPADVVSIPSDYNNAKGRAWTYEVVGEVARSDWRATLATSDYTDRAVVSSTGTELVGSSCSTSRMDYIRCVIDASSYYYGPNSGNWYDQSFIPSIKVDFEEVLENTELTEGELLEYERYAYANQ